MNDYPNAGQAYLPEEDPQIALADFEAKKKLASAIPFMDELIEWFDAQIADANRIDNIVLTSLTINGVKYDTKVAIEAQVYAHQLLKQLLEAKKVEYEAFRGTIQ